MAEAAFGEMLHGMPGNGYIIRRDGGRTRDESGRTHIYEGHFQFRERASNGFIFDTRDHTVAIPIREPLGRRVATPLLAEINIPRPVREDVVLNAP